MEKSDFDELLVQLYLRLNGYFTTGLILHSSIWGQSRTQIDCVAIRHAHHSQPDRVINCSEFLEIDNKKTDILFCEVKNEPALLKFNDALKNNSSAIKDALLWIGTFKKNDMDDITEKLSPIFQDDVDKQDMIEGITFNKYRVRPLLCCPNVDVYKSDKWCLTGGEIFGYIRQCLNPIEKRKSCSTRYNFMQWGYPFYKIIKYIKELDPSDKISANELYNKLFS